MMYQQRLTDCNTGITLGAGGADNAVGTCGARVYGKCLHLLPYFAVKLKLLYKNIVCLKKQQQTINEVKIFANHVGQIWQWIVSRIQQLENKTIKVYKQFDKQIYEMKISSTEYLRGTGNSRTYTYISMTMAETQKTYRRLALIWRNWESQKHDGKQFSV